MTTCDFTGYQLCPICGRGEDQPCRNRHYQNKVVDRDEPHVGRERVTLPAECEGHPYHSDPAWQEAWMDSCRRLPGESADEALLRKLAATYRKYEIERAWEQRLADGFADGRDDAVARGHPALSAGWPPICSSPAGSNVSNVVSDVGAGTGVAVEAKADALLDEVLASCVNDASNGPSGGEAEDETRGGDPTAKG